MRALLSTAKSGRDSRLPLTPTAGPGWLFVRCGKTGVRQDAALNRKIANALCAIAEIYMTDLW